MSHRGITYRLIPSSNARARQLACLAGACRYAWNHFLGDNQDSKTVHWKDPARHPKTQSSFVRLGKEFTQIRLSTLWLQELSFSDVRYTLKDQTGAWTKYFKWVRCRPMGKGKLGDDWFTVAEHVMLASGDSSMQIKFKSVR